jgi:hypothetical protein
VAERHFIGNPAHDLTASFLGHVTRSVLARLPGASVEWTTDPVLGVGVKVRHGKNGVGRAFGGVIRDVRVPIADLAKSIAAELCEEVTRG